MELRAASLIELQQQRAAILKSLVRCNEESNDNDAARVAARGLEGELADVSAEIAKREGRHADEAEIARRMDRAKKGEYETGAIIKPSESVREYLQTNGQIKQPEFEKLRLGALLRSMVTGARSDIEKRALAESSDNSGGISVPDVVLARFVDALRAAIVTIRMGAQTVPLSSDKNTIARTATDAVAEWRLENAPIAVDDPTFTGVVLEPKSLAVIVKCSRELLEDSLNIESALEASFRGALAAEIDRVALIGSGTPPQPEGIATNSDVNVQDHLGAVISSYDVFVDAMVQCWADNSPVVNGIVMSPFNLGVVSKLKEATTLAPLAKPAVLQDIPMAMTTNMPNTTAVLGDFSKLIIGIRTALRIELLRELYAGNHQYGFVAHLRCDIGIEQPKSFCVISNIGMS